uniref:Uncharacterized protein n=1 Tax=Rhizophora mucronata TaxID=61149 RepID=A0A2P2N224_RHIMU
MLRQRGFQIGLRLLFTTSVLHIGTQPPPSTIFDILKKGSLREKKSLLSRWEQRHVNSMTVLEATVSSAWTMIVPKFLRIPFPFLF